jgi:hypothetical protein
MPRWNIDNQVLEPAFGDRLQVLTDRAHVHSIDERCARLEDVPRLHHEFI